MGLFRIDSPFYKGLCYVTDFVSILFLWLVCCIPVLTTGASTTAFYTVAMRLHEERERYLIKEFFHAFRINFKQGTGAFFIQLFVGVILFLDLLFWWNINTPLRGIMLAVTLLMLLGYFIVSLYLYPLIAKFTNSLGAQIKNAVLFPILYLPYTVIIVGFTGLLIYMYISGSFGTSIFIFLGVPLLLFLYSKVFSMMFTRHIASHMQDYADTLSEAEQKRYIEDAELLTYSPERRKKKKQYKQGKQ